MASTAPAFLRKDGKTPGETPSDTGRFRTGEEGKKTIKQGMLTIKIFVVWYVFYENASVGRWTRYLNFPSS